MAFLLPNRGPAVAAIIYIFCETPVFRCLAGIKGEIRRQPSEKPYNCVKV